MRKVTQKTRAEETKHDFCLNPRQNKGERGCSKIIYDYAQCLTVLSFTRSSLVGMSRAPHTIATSSRAFTCHCGCIASRIVLHVSRFEVVCFPAKKKVLHSSTMSSTVTFPLAALFEARIKSPSKSFAPSDSSFPHAFSVRRSISFTNDLFISLSNFQEFKFLVVGKNLNKPIKKIL